MKLLVSTPVRFRRTPDGAVWAKQKTDSYVFWTRYLADFDTVTILGRVRPVATTPAGWLRVDGAGVTCAPVPDFAGLYQLIRHWLSVRNAVQAAVRGVGAVLLRAPCNVGTLVWKSLAKGRPYGVEVVADPYDLLAPGSVECRLRPVWRWVWPRYLRKICAGAAATAYVTRDALQGSYPPRINTFSTSYSDVMTTHYSSIDLRSERVRDAPRPCQTGKNTHTVICVGAMEVLYKAQDVLIRACGLCVAHGLDLRLVLVGDGKMRRGLEILANEVGIACRTTFAGQLSCEEEVTQALDQADLFVLPSRAEGLPRAMIEAMARGLPCIGSNVGGIPELISPESLTPPDDAPALAAKIEEVLRMPGRMRQMSEENLERISMYSEEVLTGRRRTFYSHLASETARWYAAGALSVPAEGGMRTANR